MEKEKRKYTKKLKPEEASPVPAPETHAAPIVPVEISPVKVEPTVNAVMLTHDAWRYHETEEPRIFTAGEIVPEGWHPGQSKLKRLWFRDSNGYFSRINRG